MISLSKRAWDLQRFGLSPQKILNRTRSQLIPHPVLVVSIPKAGTHLVERAICLWPQCYRAPKPTLRRGNNWGGEGLAKTISKAKPGQVFFVHGPWDPEVQRSIEETNTKVVFVVRHPLDILLSFSHHVMTLKTHWLHEKFKDIEKVEDRIALALKGDEARKIPAYSEKLEKNLPWIAHSSQIVKFEDLVGEKGGGSRDIQKKTLYTLWDKLELGVGDEVERERILELTFSSASPTFRKGKIGRGMELSEPLKQEFFQRNRELLEKFGY